MKIITQDNLDCIKSILAEQNWSRTALYNEINKYILYNCPQIGIIKSKSTLNDFLDGKHGLFEPNERRVKAWLDWYDSCKYVGEDEQVVNEPVKYIRVDEMRW